MNPDLPSKPEERTNDIKPTPKDTQLRSDRKVNPFQDDRSDPRKIDAPKQPESESTFESDLDDLDDFSPTSSIRLDRPGLTNNRDRRPMEVTPVGTGPSNGYGNPLRRYTSIQPARQDRPTFTPTAQNVSHVRPTRYVPVQKIPTAPNPLR